MLLSGPHFATDHKNIQNKKNNNYLKLYVRDNMRKLATYRCAFARNKILFFFLKKPSKDTYVCICNHRSSFGVRFVVPEFLLLRLNIKMNVSEASPKLNYDKKNCDLYFILHLQILEEEKVHQKLTLGEYPLYLVPLDEDVICFELDHSLQVLIHTSAYSLRPKI